VAICERHLRAIATTATSTMAHRAAPPSIALGLVLATFLVLMGATWFRHTDVGDAQVYQVIARNMVRDHRWISLRYLPGVHAHFYDHLPFGFWPMAAAMRWIGPWAIIPLCALFSLGIVGLTCLTAYRLGGGWAGLAAMFVLGTTETFFFQTGYPTLDPLLMLLATAAALPILTGRLRARDWVLAGALAGAAMAVKGPFGPLPFAGAVVARAVVDRRWRTLFVGGAVLLLAAAPVAAFLYTHRDWWSGYGVHQLLESLTGARRDGNSHPLFALRSIAGRFWPYLPLLAPAIVVALGRPREWNERLLQGTQNAGNARRACRLMLIATAVVIIGLSLPQRKIWHHVLLVYPFLSILIGVGLARPLARAFSTAQRIRRGLFALGLILSGSMAADALGLGRILMNPPCVLAAEFARPAASLSPGEEVLVVSKVDEWDMLSALAFEKDVIPWPSLELDPLRHTAARFAFVKADAWSPNAGWAEVAAARGWVMATRTPGP